MKNLDYRYILKWSNKIRAINLLGGKCVVCGNDNIVCLDFHHQNEKTNSVGQILEGRWSKIEKESKKCILLCKNCHMERHSESGTRCSLFKIKLLEMKGVNSCQKCGYSGERFSSLDFHHRISESKDFCMGNAFRFITTMKDKIELELNKCDVICRNCHALEHFDKKKFDLFKGKILEFLKTHKERKETKEIDWSKVKYLNSIGLTNSEICEKMDLAASTVSTVLKRIGLKSVKGERKNLEKKKICLFCKNEFSCFEASDVDKRKYCCISCKQNGDRKLKINKEELVAFLKTESYSSLAGRFNVAPNTIKNLAKRYNIIN